MGRRNMRMYGVVAAILCLLLIILIYRQIGALKAAQSEIIEKQKTVSDAQAKIKSIEQVKVKAEEFENELGALEQILPSSPREDQVIQDLEGNANRDSMRLLQVNFEKYNVQKDLIEMPFKITLEGDYQDSLLFLNDLQAGPRTVTINEIKLNKAQQDEPEIKVDISASVFYVPK